jgi:hypothetical protein
MENVTNPAPMNNNKTFRANELKSRENVWCVMLTKGDGQKQKDDGCKWALMHQKWISEIKHIYVT